MRHAIFFRAVTDIEIIGSHLSRFSNLSIFVILQTNYSNETCRKRSFETTRGTLHRFIPRTYQKIFKSWREHLFRTIPVYFWLGRPWVPITSPMPCDFLDLVTRNGPYSPPTHRPIRHRFCTPAYLQTLFTLRKSQLGLFLCFKIHIFL